MNRLCLLVIGVAGLMTSCQNALSNHSHVPAKSPNPSVETIRASILTPPVTFIGDLPCADCPGRRVVVSLRSDGIFLLRQTYVGVAAGKDGHVNDLGRWVVSQDSARLILQCGTEASWQFAIKDSRTLRMLTQEGNEIQSRLNYDLAVADSFDPIEDRMRLRGMFAYLADAPSLTECVTGHRFSVAQEEEYPAVERAYVSTRRVPGEHILVAMEGRLTRRPIGEGGALKDAIVVDHFDRMWPGETCARLAMSKASLTNTFWRPVEIAGKPVEVAANQREPHLMLVPGENKMRGFGGCNHIQGRYEVQGEALHFVGTAATRMFCQETMEQEGAFLHAIESAATYKVVGETLELYDMNGALLARFESRYFR
jgi:copper homeostasis protein (lipoprotein)